MKMVYIATSVIPAEKANSYQVMKMCEALTKAGAEVELVIPVRFGGVTLKVSPFKYYGIKEKFKIKKIFSLDLIPLKKYIGHLGFWIQNISFSFLALIYLLFRRYDFIYSRDRFTLLFLSLFKKNLVYEVHSLPGKFRFYEKFLYRRMKSIIVVTEQMKKTLVNKKIINQDKVLVAPDAVDLGMFRKVKKSKRELREELKLPQDKKLIGYVGQPYTKGREKGIDNMLQALKILKDKGRNDLIMAFVGGKIRLRKDDLIFIRQVPFTDVPKYEKAFDVLVIPFPWEKHYAYYASPLKLFEYMASGRPIVASDLPSLREVLNNKNAILVKPDDPKDLARGIKKALQNQDLAKQAFLDVQRYTWDKRAELIINNV